MKIATEEINRKKITKNNIKNDLNLENNLNTLNIQKLR